MAFSAHQVGKESPGTHRLKSKSRRGRLGFDANCKNLRQASHGNYLTEKAPMSGNGALPKSRKDPQVMSAPAPKLRAKRSWVATGFFASYMVALIIYFAIRCMGIAKGMTNWLDRGYSIAVLVVEAIGVSALIPYAFANLRPTLPVEEPERKENEDPITWAEFGVRDNFDVFILVPCYKESWATIKRTLMCAMFARVPPGCRKHIILGNDGHDVDNANCRRRRQLVEDLQLAMRGVYRDQPDWFYAIHQSNRFKVRCDQDNKKFTGEDKRIAGNAKSLNLNHCIKIVIPNILARHHQRERNASSAEPRLCDFSDAVLRRSVVVVLDCDMAITNDPNEVMLANTPPRNGDGVGFLPKVLRVLQDDRFDLVLTPQKFTNVTPYADVFNHLNPQFWEYILPGLTTLGYVACTGTNMGLRLSMLHNHSSTNDRNENQAVKEFAKGQGGPSARYEAAMQGPFPVYSVTEDYALSLELKKAGVKGTYIKEYLVKGAAPPGITAVDTQRGRWTEGHYQIFFSRKNPFFHPFKLGLMGAIYYNYGTLAYLANIITIWVYQFVPLLSALDLQPVAFSSEFRYAATAYLVLTTFVQYYVREAPHYYGMWRANMSNIVLSWTYTKAIFRAALGTKSGFATHTEAEDAPDMDDLMPNPPMPEKPDDNLVQEKVIGITGQLLYFTLLLLLSLATIAICVTKTIKSGKFHSRFFLPAAWAAYNAVGPLLFFCAALMKKTKNLEMAMHSLCTLHSVMAVAALAAMWFVNSALSIGYMDSTQQK
ncbi:hypothetical protein OEZ86_003683 [Tetradesmus obliquus]|nr:hypothetical protein OEZ86_003683 [Tetradesmus obliquus]